MSPSVALLATKVGSKEFYRKCSKIVVNCGRVCVLQFADLWAFSTACIVGSWQSRFLEGDKME